MKKLSLILLVTFSFIQNLYADEGMWIPLLVEKYNLADMQAKGFKLTAEDLYSINQPSIKDAIVMFGRGCTGGIISDEGLVITNHHCGYGAIQRLSTIENDLLSQGFWAMNRDEELHSPGLTVNLLVRIEEVTGKVLRGVTSNMTEVTRDSMVAANSNAISDSVVKGTTFTARVAPFFYGNQYFMYVYETYSDVRLVGAPPSSIGKFGGDTDNWMWPRHTGDFAFFRIYANNENKPAEYSPDNVPYKPKRFLPISLSGVKPNDFTMVYGYPGRTEQYITSHAVEQVIEVSNPVKIALRDIRLSIMDKYMRENDTVRLKYASKHASTANAWKKWIGERNGLLRLKAVDRKRSLEEEFVRWVNELPERQKEYGHLIPTFLELYNRREALTLANDLAWEAFRAVEINRLAQRFQRLIAEFQTGSEPDLVKVESLKQELISEIRRFYKDYHQPIDREVFVNVIRVFAEKAPSEIIPNFLAESIDESNNDWKRVVSTLFSQSILADSTKLIHFTQNIDFSSSKMLLNDPFYILNSQFDSLFNSKISTQLQQINKEIDVLYRSYVKGLMEMQPQKIFYPDANFTMRISYGNVAGYYPSDAVEYLHQTTLDGIAEKATMEVYDYEVPTKLLDLYRKKDFGRWAADGTVPVAFIATNHTSGGNSGSPVINAEGQLIGVNFDRVWEGTMSDIMFDPDMCRNITLDIRYALFVVDKFAGAGHLLNEMRIITP